MQNRFPESELRPSQYRDARRNGREGGFNDESHARRFQISFDHSGSGNSRLPPGSPSLPFPLTSGRPLCYSAFKHGR